MSGTDIQTSCIALPPRIQPQCLLVRFPRLFQSLEIARSTGKLLTFLKMLARQDVLILELCEVKSYVE